MELYPLDVKDIEAIAKARASRNLPSSIKNWLYGGFVVFAAGIIYWIFKGEWIALGIMVIGAILTWYSTILVDKRRKTFIKELKWQFREFEKKQGVNKQ